MCLRVAHLVIDSCHGGGTCAVACPSGVISVNLFEDEYDPRKIARVVNLGMRKRVLSSPYIWYCATCHNCEQHCPQNVKFFNVLNVLKKYGNKGGICSSFMG